MRVWIMSLQSTKSTIIAWHGSHWSESECDKTSKMTCACLQRRLWSTCAPNQSDKSIRLALGPNSSSCGQRRLTSLLGCSEANLSLRWAHMWRCRLWRNLAQFWYMYLTLKGQDHHKEAKTYGCCYTLHILDTIKKKSFVYQYNK